MKTAIKVGKMYFEKWHRTTERKVNMNGHSQFTNVVIKEYYPLFNSEPVDLSVQSVPEIIRILLDGMRFGDTEKQKITIEVE